MNNSVCEDDDAVTAYHEAGHVFMAIRLGGYVQRVTLIPEYDDGPERYGDTTIAWPRSLDDPSTRRAAILAALGGPVAEMIYRGEPWHPGRVPEWAGDWRTAWALAAPLARDDAARLRALEQLTIQLHQTLTDDGCWQAVAALADELMAHEFLEAEQIHDVVRQWI